MQNNKLKMQKGRVEAAFDRLHADAGNYQVIRHGDWFIASRRAFHHSTLNNQFVAWAKRGPHVTQNPVLEPGDVWFDFGRTREEAVAGILAELKSLPKPSPWRRLLRWLNSPPRTTPDPGPHRWKWGGL